MHHNFHLAAGDWHGYVIPGTRPGIPVPGRGQGTLSATRSILYPYPRHG